MTAKVKKKKNTNKPAVQAVKPLTYVALVLDKSGSMAKTKRSVIEGFNEQVQQLKQDAKDQDIRCCLITFNGEVFEHLWNVTVDKLTEASDEDYKPDGSTAMRDAIGFTIQKLLNTTNPEDPNVAYLVKVISDGETNADKHYNVPALREIVEACQGSGKWTFAYMGCSEQYLREIERQTSTPISNMAVWSNKTGVEAKAGFDNMKLRDKKYFAARCRGASATPMYMSDAVGACADFTKEAPPEDDAPLKEVVISPTPTAPADLRKILEKLPRYTDSTPTWTVGERIFANALNVKWEQPDQSAEVREANAAAWQANAGLSNMARRVR